jgi:hypothetical protein
MGLGFARERRERSGTTPPTTADSRLNRTVNWLQEELIVSPLHGNLVTDEFFDGFK